MTSDVDRKKLWGRSGSRCAICNRALTQLDKQDAIVGDEAHIRSRKRGGPRHDPAYPSDAANRYPNLILLCRLHHKLVDDRPEDYPTERLEEIKNSHEKRVSRALDRENALWVKAPTLRLLANGTELAEVVVGASAYFMSNDHPAGETEASLISGLLQEARDWGDIAGEIGVDGRVRAGLSLDEGIRSLAERGLVVAAGLGHYRIAPDFVAPTAVIKVLRVTQHPEAPA